MSCETKSLNLMTPVNQLGYGVVGYNLAKAFANRQYDLGLFPTHGTVDIPGYEGQNWLTNAVARATFYDPNAPCLRLNHQFLMTEFVGRGKRLGYTFFEGDVLLPSERHQLSSVDVMFVASRWAKDVCVANGIPAGRLAILRPGVDSDVFHTGVTPAPLPKPTPDTTVFLACGKWEYRKGADFLLEAFTKAFTRDDDVLLVANCHNPLVLPGFDGPAVSRGWARQYMHSPLGRAGRIRVAAERLPDQHAVAALMAAADCGVFPARCEGWNLELAEMLAVGKPCVATDYSAHTEYAHEAGCRLIEITEEEAAFDGYFFNGDRGRWAALGQRQLDQAVEHLRAVHRVRQGQGPQTNPAGPELFRRLTWENAISDYEAGA
jgi:glycosyltransferase involved in cell wall biosynthesis